MKHSDVSSKIEIAQSCTRENPYKPPQRSELPAAFKMSSGGLWRDGDKLVIAVDNHSFPARCIKTNAFSDTTAWVNVAWIPHRAVWLLLFGVIGHQIAKWVFGRSFTLRLPVSIQWLSRYGRISQIGWLMVFGGVFCMIASSFVNMFAAIAFGLEKWIFLPLLGFALFTLAGALFLFVRHKPIVTARAMVGEYAWLDGVHADYLADLPEWPN